MKLICAPYYAGRRLTCVCGAVWELEASDEPDERIDKHGEIETAVLQFNCPLCDKSHFVDVRGKETDANPDEMLLLDGDPAGVGLDAGRAAGFQNRDGPGRDHRQE